MIESAVALAVALLALLGVLTGHILARLHHLETEIDDARGQNRALWHYCRRLQDLYYRHRIPGSPDPDPLPDYRD